MGVQQALNPDEAGGIGAEEFQESESTTWSEYAEGCGKGASRSGTVYSTNENTAASTRAREAFRRC